jgi:hypothetical protein
MTKKPAIATPQLPKERRSFVIHPRIVVTERSGAVILKQMRTGKATKALRELMRDED